MAYFVAIEGRKGRDPNRAIPDLKDVLRSLADPTPIGVAFPLGPNRVGRTLWRLNIDGVWVKGIFTIVRRKFEPARIGKARCCGRRADGLATWKLTVRGAELPGLWIVVDRKFQPVQ